MGASPVNCKINSTSASSVSLGFPAIPVPAHSARACAPCSRTYMDISPVPSSWGTATSAPTWTATDASSPEEWMKQCPCFASYSTTRTWNPKAS